MEELVKESYFSMRVTFMLLSGAKKKVSNGNWRFSLNFSGAGGMISLIKCYHMFNCPNIIGL